MTLTQTIIGMVICIMLWVIVGWREKKRHLGVVPLLSPHTVQFILLIMFFVFAANLFAQITGITWTPPFLR